MRALLCSDAFVFFCVQAGTFSEAMNESLAEADREYKKGEEEVCELAQMFSV